MFLPAYYLTRLWMGAKVSPKLNSELNFEEEQ
ncbi:hypothetical protein SBA7_100005 [Candidatus Sulfotelmatobacter sp. SbA7]|nr:hypothetical protein SBA7_100005 [Candidatus Sulfotelmatobacter sp. SbA7]